MMSKLYRNRNSSNVGKKQNNPASADNRGRQLAARGNMAVRQRPDDRALVRARKEEEWQQNIERTHGGIDIFMLAIVIVLLALGALTVYSASYPTAQSETGNSFYYLTKHLIFMGIGAIAMIIFILFPYRRYKNWLPYVMFAVTVILLILVLFKGSSEGEAKRWIYLGPISVQPSEIMKLALIMALALYMERYCDMMRSTEIKKEIWKYNAFIPLAPVAVACGLVMLEKHLSGTLILAIIAVAVLLVGGCRPKPLILTCAVLGFLAIGAFLIINPYALKRITTFTSEDVDKLAEGWQTAQGVLAIGSGGLFGVGFSESRQKFSYVSMAHNDFIFSIWCEELGFVGALLLIALFLLLIWRGYTIAMRAPDKFSSLVAFGITTQIGIQAFLNMMVVCDIAPNTGISLPFFSYGGSSLIMVMAEMGVLLGISRYSYRKGGSK